MERYFQAVRQYSTRPLKRKLMCLGLFSPNK